MTTTFPLQSVWQPFARVSGLASSMLAAMVMVMSGCGGGSASAPTTLALSSEVHVFKGDLGGWTPDNGRWYNYVLSDALCPSGYGFPISSISGASCFEWLTPGSGAGGDWITSTGPWWIDQNHMMLPGGDGFGFINVLAFTQLPAGFRSPASLDDTVVSFTARIDERFSTVEAPSREGRRQGHVYLWFQTFARPISPCTPDPSIGEDCTRQSDYILTGGWDPAYEIDRMAPGVARNFKFTLKASEPENWTCLGRGANVKYDCMGLEQALKNVAVVGLVIGPATSCPTTLIDGVELCDTQRIATSPKDYLNLGRFDLRGFAIVKARARATMGARIAFANSPPDRALPAEGWSAIRYADATPFGIGSGLQMPIKASTGAVRLGLAHAPDADKLEEAGYQIYLSPAGTDPGQTKNVLLIVSRNEDGRYDKVLSFWPYQAGDTVGFYFEAGKLLFLKNDEVVFQVASLCSNSLACMLHPFVSSYGGPGELPPVYRY